jgi:hypothetical protein
MRFEVDISDDGRLYASTRQSLGNDAPRGLGCPMGRDGFRCGLTALRQGPPPGEAM